MDNVRTLAEKMQPFRVMYTMAENQVYSWWIAIPKNRRKVTRVSKIAGIRRIIRGPVDKYGKVK